MNSNLNHVGVRLDADNGAPTLGRCGKYPCKNSCATSHIHNIAVQATVKSVIHDDLCDLAGIAWPIKIIIPSLAGELRPWRFKIGKGCCHGNVRQTETLWLLS